MYILWSIQKRSVLLNLWCYRESLSFGISLSSLNYKLCDFRQAFKDL